MADMDVVYTFGAVVAQIGGDAVPVINGADL